MNSPPQAATAADGSPRQRVNHQPGPLGRIARLCFRRRGTVLLAWLFSLGLAIGLSQTLGDEPTNAMTLSGSDSAKAQTLLSERFPDQAGDRVDVVVQADDVTVDGVQSRVESLLDEMEAVPNVVAVDDPYAANAAVSPDGRTLVARVHLGVPNPNDMPVENTDELLSLADEAEGAGVDIALGGQAVQIAEQPENHTELIGLAAAAIILLFTFGSVVAAGLPLGVAIGGLAVSMSLVGLVAAAFDVPDYASLIMAMLGIAVGIDYALLMVTRFREWRAAGLDTESATAATLDTAGRAVLVAGATVMVSMAGLFAMGMSIMDGTAVVTMVGVLVVLIAALTLFPAMLGYLGTRIDRLRLPMRRRPTAHVDADGHLVAAPGWVRWSRFVQRRSGLAATGAFAVLILLALPFLGARFAIPDAGNDPAGTSNREAYEVVADAFGPGTSGPLLVVADTREADGAVVERLRAHLLDTAGVAAVSQPQFDQSQDTALLSVLPSTGPQDGATEDLVHAVRDDAIPAAVADSEAKVHVGGRTATTIDMNSEIVDRLPYLIGGVVIVSVLLLLVAFRSVLIALTAALMNLLSVGAALGVLAFFLDGGWAGGLVGIDDPAPIAGYVPVIMFALLFGLSMDYEVFLISRMSETWVRTRDNGQAVLQGLAGTGRVITAAATIMIVVFAAMIAIDNVIMKSFGIGMVAAILVDATIVRMLLVPAVMQLLGRWNWWLPRVLDRWLPRFHVEGRPDAYAPERGDPSEPYAEVRS